VDNIDGEQKQWLKDQVLSQLKIQVSGLSGLYIYYILLSHNLLKEGGIATWLIPSEFLYTNYGKAFQEKRDPPLYLSTYMGRSRADNTSPIRFFLNNSNGIVTNVFICLYPRLPLLRLLKEDPARKQELLHALNSISQESIERAGRSYGGGLQKIEPKELRSVRLDTPPSWLSIAKETQAESFYQSTITL